MQKMRWRGFSSLIDRVRPVLKASDYVAPRGTSGNVFGGKMQPFACVTCDEQVTDAQRLWICHACGEYRSPKCATSTKQGCPVCKAEDVNLNQPLESKALRGAALVKDPRKTVAASRLAVHSVAVDAELAFLIGNKSKNVGLHEYAVHCYNWIGCAAPEHFHAQGFDAQLVRSAAMRAHLSGDAGEAKRLSSEAPELFVNQGVLPVDAADETKLIRRVATLNKTNVGSLFLDLTSAGPPDPRAEPGWKRVGEINLKSMGHVTAAWDVWKSDVTRAGNFRWVFPTSPAAAHFLTSQFADLSEGLHMVSGALSVGTDCVVYDGVTKAKTPGAEALLVVIYCFREENVVVKTGLSRPLRAGASTASMAIAHYEARLAAYHHAAAVQRLLESHRVVAPTRSLWSRFFG
jgi:chorismate mutase